MCDIKLSVRPTKSKYSHITTNKTHKTYWTDLFKSQPYCVTAKHFESIKNVVFFQHFDSINHYKRNRCIPQKFITCKFSYMDVPSIILVTYIATNNNFPSLQFTKQNFKSPAKYTLSNAVYQNHLLLKIISYNNCLYKPKTIFQNK